MEEWSGETRARSPALQVLAVERRVVGGCYWEEEVLVVVAGGEHGGGGGGGAGEIDARKMRSKSDADYMLSRGYTKIDFFYFMKKNRKFVR